MAMLRTVAVAAVVLMVVLGMALEAQAACPSATSMFSCQSCVTKMNQTPTLTCCNQVKSVIQGPDGPACLCAAMTSTTAQQFHVIKSEALSLPAKCAKIMGLQYIKGYDCDGSIVH